jgi:hypothetical protein
MRVKDLMSKVLSRLISCLFVLCLLTENISAISVTSASQPVHNIDFSAKQATLFRQEALVSMAVGATGYILGAIRRKNAAIQHEVSPVCSRIPHRKVNLLNWLTRFLHEKRPANLSADHFISLTQEQALEKKATQWACVRALDDNDPRKILFFRRFIDEWTPTPARTPRVKRELEPDLFAFYAVDTSKFLQLSPVQPYRTQMNVPTGARIGIVVGAHDLEKPWGILFMEMFKQQVSFPDESVKFILVQNKEVDTGYVTPKSEQEILEAVEKWSLTHIIDVHERMRLLNRYEDFDYTGDEFKPHQFKPYRYYYLLDPFIPIWAIEQYYEGRIYPQLQYAVNDQIRRIERLVISMSKIDNTNDPPRASWSKEKNFVQRIFRKLFSLFSRRGLRGRHAQLTSA